MPNINPHIEARLLRPKSDREQMLERIAADCCAAWQHLKDGKSHHRKYDSVASRERAERRNNDWRASFQPELPRIHMSEPWGQLESIVDRRDLNT